MSSLITKLERLLHLEKKRHSHKAKTKKRRRGAPRKKNGEFRKRR